MWQADTDLDLHCVPPSGERIFFSHQRSNCGGVLDIDMTNIGQAEHVEGVGKTLIENI